MKLLVLLLLFSFTHAGLDYYEDDSGGGGGGTLAYYDDDDNNYYPSPSGDEPLAPIQIVPLDGSFVVECPDGAEESAAAVMLLHNGELAPMAAGVSRRPGSFLVERAQPAQSGSWSCTLAAPPAQGSGGRGRDAFATAAAASRVLVAAADSLVLLVDRMPVWGNNSVIAVRQDDVIDITCAVLSSGGRADNDNGRPLPSTSSSPPPPSPVWTAVMPDDNSDDIDDASVVLPTPQHRVGRIGDNDQFAVTSLPNFKVPHWRPTTTTPTEVPRADGSLSLPPPPHRRHQLQLMCRVPTQALSIELDVEFQPEFTISRSPGFGVPIVEGMDVTLRCSVESNPSASPYWEHNGSRLPDHGRTSAPSAAAANPVVISSATATEIRFEAIRLGSEGWYQCSAEHKFGNFSSVGYYLSVKPMLVQQRPAGGGLAMAAETPSWDFPGLRQQSFSLGRAGAAAQEQQRRTTTSGQLAEQVLLMGMTGQDDANSAARQSGCGTAGGGGVGGVGAGEGEQTPTVVISPEVRTVTVAEGSAVSLHLKFCTVTLPPPAAHQLRIFWSGPRQLLLAAGQSDTQWSAAAMRPAADTSAGCHLAELSGQPVSQADAGLYLLVVVVAADPQSVAVGRLILEVTAADDGPPPPPPVASGAAIFFVASDVSAPLVTPTAAVPMVLFLLLCVQ